MNFSTVTIYCLDSTHDGRRTVVTKFLKIEGQDSQGQELLAQEWRETPGSSAKAQKAHRERLEGKKPQTTREKLQMKQRADKPGAYQGRGMVGHSGFRVRYRLRCELCGITVPAREEKLFPILDQLVEGGASSISLAALRATLPEH